MIEENLFSYTNGHLEIYAPFRLVKRRIFRDFPVEEITSITVRRQFRCFSGTFFTENDFFKHFPNLRQVQLEQYGEGKWLDDLCDTENIFDRWLIRRDIDPEIEIEAGTFEGCECLESVIIDGLIPVNYPAYAYFYGMHSSHLVFQEPLNPDQDPPYPVRAVQTNVIIRNSAFSHCPRLREVRIQNAFYVYFEEPVHLRFSGCDALADENGFGWDADRSHILFYRPPVRDGRLEISGQLSEICEQQFSCREDIREVQIHPGVVKLCAEAFSYCPNLAKVVIPETVTFIASDAFEGCEQLREILRPDGTPIDY